MPEPHAPLNLQTPAARPGLTRRGVAMLLGGGLLAGRVQARDSALPVPASLRQAGDMAAARREPLVVLVSLPGCPYCELVRRNYLLPMRAEGLHAWQINVTDRQQAVADFAGRPSTGPALAAQWKATFTPTVLFFNPQGLEIAERLVGVASPDFYGGYLDGAIAQARTVMARQNVYKR